MPTRTNSSARDSSKSVSFCEDANKVHDLPDDLDKSDRGQYWYSKEELQEMLRRAMVETAEALKEAREKAKNGVKGGDGLLAKAQEHTLRGLESLSSSAQARKKQTELELLRVIQTYSKQKRQNGSVDEDSIRKLYQSFSEEDRKRALAFAQMDAKESYWYDANYRPTKKTSGKGMRKVFSRMFHTNGKAKSKQK